MTTFENTTLAIGIGAPRTGTRWMANYFAKHPQILMSPLRVVHYFDARFDPEAAAEYNKYFRDRLSALPQQDADGPRGQATRDRVAMIDDESAYIRHFRNAWSGQKVIADITPAYWKVPAEGYQMMMRMHPKVRLIFVMRNPIDRFWSGIRLQRSRNDSVDPYQLFDKRVRPARARKKEPENYGRTIATLDSSVPADAVKYIFYEDLFGNQTATEELCSFLGVDYVPAEIETPVHPSFPAKLDDERRARGYKMFEADFRFLNERFGGKLPKKWLDDIERFSAEPSV